MKTFEDYLRDIHAENYMGTDDDMPEAFDDWVDTLSAMEVWAHAGNYGREMYDLGQLKEHESNTEVTH